MRPLQLLFINRKRVFGFRIIADTEFDKALRTSCCSLNQILDYPSSPHCEKTLNSDSLIVRRSLSALLRDSTLDHAVQLVSQGVVQGPRTQLVDRLSSVVERRGSPSRRCLSGLNIGDRPV